MIDVAQSDQSLSQLGPNEGDLRLTGGRSEDEVCTINNNQNY